jgi:AraC family transcriptional regulator, regulatory protein of adaptative response / methylated-DNA-[protein]-cysteine methyltransferase
MAGMKTTRVTAINSGSKILYAVGVTSLGCVLVARGAGGVCAILLGDDSQAVIRDLRAHFVGAEMRDDTSGMAETVAAAVASVEHPERPFDPPLDIGGTTFQRKVWRALREIPPGTTTSYSEVARTIGAPKSLRAVAGACAANVLAIAIPCHRVLRSNGSLSGYRWGMERKRILLEREKTL